MTSRGGRGKGQVGGVLKSTVRLDAPFLLQGKRRIFFLGLGTTNHQSYIYTIHNIARNI